jgi:hypothetical protein
MTLLLLRVKEKKKEQKRGGGVALAGPCLCGADYLPWGCACSPSHSTGAAIYKRDKGHCGGKETPTGSAWRSFEKRPSRFSDLLMQNNAKNAVKTTEGKNDITFLP